jgi:hypothetical protein
VWEAHQWPLKFRDTVIRAMQKAHVSIGIDLYYIHATSDGFLSYTLHTKFDDHGLQYVPKALDIGISSTDTQTIDIRPTTLPFTDTDPLNMTLVSNDPIWWPTIILNRESSYAAGS